MTVPAGSPHVGLVVEGPGDVRAVPMLLRAYLAAKGDYADVLGKPVPFHGKGNATATGGIEGYVATAARPGCVGVLVILDADDELVCEEGPRLLARAQPVIAQPVVLAIAERDYEDWLYASTETLELPNPQAWDDGMRGKSAIQRGLAPEKYVKPTHQPRLTARVDIDLASSRSASLSRALRKFDDLRALVSP